MLREKFHERLSGPLAGGVEAIPVDRERFKTEVLPVIERNLRMPQPIWSEAEQERFRELEEGLVPDESMKLAFVHEGRIVGGFDGLRQPRGRFFMALTALDASVQGRGAYGVFVDKVVAFARDEGFRDVWSYHHIHNNRVLAAKLKRGFVISSVALDIRHGMLMSLTNFLSEDARRAHAFRAGDLSQLSPLLESGAISIKAQSEPGRP